MPRDIPVGNGSLLVNFDHRYLLRDLYWPHVGHYGGDQRQRDAAYHQGTVWAWLIGPFVTAHLRVYGDPEQARSFLEPFIHHLGDHGVGSVSEIFDGAPPFAPRGCIAQAWSLAELLRAWRTVKQLDGGKESAARRVN